MSWYLFYQNNSGGRFVVNDNVCHRLFIEAESNDDAINTAEGIGCYWSGVALGIDCPCCGDRWSNYDAQPIEIPKQYGVVEEYAQHLADAYRTTTPDTRIFYANGDVTEIF